MKKDLAEFRRNIVGAETVLALPYGERKLLYADWMASGRLYRPIEEYLSSKLGPYVANPHTETTLTGTLMTHAYHDARKIIKEHVNASENDVLLPVGFGMTSAINKLQRIIGLRIPEKLCRYIRQIEHREKPLVIISHLEHHSNQTTWEECCCDVRILRRGNDGLPDLEHLREILEENRNREMKIGSFSACSNVTGIITPFYRMASLMHRYGGLCFVDFAASAPYVEIDMHPASADEKLDAIFFSPHKFLGGPGAAGILVFDRDLYQLQVPDQPGGGTVLWTNPWGEHKYFDDIELREDGGTPGFLQTVKAALALRLKEEMGLESMLEAEEKLKDRLLDGLAGDERIKILESEQRNRLGIVSFYVPGLHHNLVVRLLNDRFGIQTRGGCSCAGTYGHILLEVNREKSRAIVSRINQGDLSEKPGWVRVSLHPTMNLAEVDQILLAIGEVLDNYRAWSEDYVFDSSSGEFFHKTFTFNRLDLRPDLV